MNKTKFLASLPAKILVIQVLAILGITFSGCSRETDKEEPRENFFMIDGRKLTPAKIMSALESDRFIVCVEFEKSDKDRDHFLLLSGYVPERQTGSTIDLTKREAHQDGKFTWRVRYSRTDDIFDLHTDDPQHSPVFKSGVLKATIDPKTLDCEVSLTNGVVKEDKYGDGKEHSLSLYYKGATVIFDD